MSNYIASKCHRNLTLFHLLPLVPSFIVFKCSVETLYMLRTSRFGICLLHNILNANTIKVSFFWLFWSFQVLSQFKTLCAHALTFSYLIILIFVKFLHQRKRTKKHWECERPAGAKEVRYSHVIWCCNFVIETIRKFALVSIGWHSRRKCSNHFTWWQK